MQIGLHKAQVKKKEDTENEQNDGLHCFSDASANRIDANNVYGTVPIINDDGDVQKRHHVDQSRGRQRKSSRKS